MVFIQASRAKWWEADFAIAEYKSNGWRFLLDDECRTRRFAGTVWAFRFCRKSVIVEIDFRCCGWRQKWHKRKKIAHHFSWMFACCLLWAAKYDREKVDALLGVKFVTTTSPHSHTHTEREREREIPFKGCESTIAKASLDTPHFAVNYKYAPPANFLP